MGDFSKKLTYGEHPCIEIWGLSREEMLNHASTELVNMFVSHEKVEPRKEVEWTVDASSPEELMTEQLRAIIKKIKEERMVFSDFWISLRGLVTIKCLAHGEPIDPNRHHVKNGVRGAHCDRVEMASEDKVWTAQITFDL